MNSVKAIELNAYGQTKPVGFSARVPWDVYVSQNQVLNRLLIDVLGMEVPSLGLARNNFERAERGFDFLFRLVISFVLPVISGIALNRYFKGKILKQFSSQFHNLKKANPLAIPFEKLSALKMQAPLSFSQKQLFSETQLKSLNLPAELRKKLLNAKLTILALDMFLMASKGQSYFWFKNWFTKKYSGQSGFSGEFNYTNEKFRKEKSSDYENNKKKRHFLAALVGYGWSMSLPLLVMVSLNSKAKRGPLAVFKKIVPAFNYSNVIYMSKWVMIWHMLANWNLAGAITARDSHERREHLIKSLSGDFFFILGDDLISGIATQFMQRKHAKNLLVKQNGKQEPINLIQKKILGLPIAESYQSIQRQVQLGKYQLSTPKAKQILMQIGRAQFWAGLLGTSAGLGVFMTLFNNYLTKKKVQKELLQKQQQEALKLQQDQALRQQQQAWWQNGNNYSAWGVSPS